MRATPWIICGVAVDVVTISQPQLVLVETYLYRSIIGQFHLSIERHSKVLLSLKLTHYQGLAACLTTQMPMLAVLLQGMFRSVQGTISYIMGVMGLTHQETPHFMVVVWTVQTLPFVIPVTLFVMIVEKLKVLTIQEIHL